MLPLPPKGSGDQEIISYQGMRFQEPIPPGLNAARPKRTQVSKVQGETAEEMDSQGNKGEGNLLKKIEIEMHLLKHVMVGGKLCLQERSV